jgi:hypothetical protein
MSFFTGEYMPIKRLYLKTTRIKYFGFTFHIRVRPHLKRQPQRLDHFQDVSELGVAVGGHRAVQALEAQAGIAALDAWVWRGGRSLRPV